MGDLHKLVEGYHLKNNRGDSHSHKKRAVPVDAWPETNPIPWGTPRKNMGKFPQGSPLGNTAVGYPHIVDIVCLSILGDQTQPEVVPLLNY